MDEAAWLIGGYVYEAVFVSIGKFFGGKDFNVDYPEKPRTHGILTPEERQQKLEQREIERMIAWEEKQIALLRKAGLPESNAN